MEHVAQWDFHELCLDGPATGNPYLEVEFSAHFCFGHRVVEVAGFYNGDGTYKVRFMPDVQGEWRYTTSSNREELSGRCEIALVGKPFMAIRITKSADAA